MQSLLAKGQRGKSGRIDFKQLPVSSLVTHECLICEMTNWASSIKAIGALWSFIKPSLQIYYSGNALSYSLVVSLHFLWEHMSINKQENVKSHHYSSVKSMSSCLKVDSM